VVGLLVLVGLVMVLSASSDLALRQFQDPWRYFEHQVLWVALGTLALVVCCRLDYQHWQRMGAPLVVVVLAMLLAVLVPGVGLAANGSSRWLGLGSWRIQPGEVAKLAVVVFAADLLTRRAARAASARLVFRPIAVVVAVLSGLMLYQPDMGTAMVVCAIAFVMLFAGGTRLRTLCSGLTLLVIAGFFVGLVEPYRRRRLLAFLHPLRDASNTGYQVIQGRVGMASGRLFGVGLGASRAKAGYLPNAHTDFIFAIIGEEAGLLGSLIVVALFVTFTALGLRAAFRARDRFGALLAIGITVWIGVQALLNIAAVTGIVPVTGVPLPLVSFGGSSVVITMGAIGVLANVARQAG